jgi:cytochrome P450
MSWTFYLLSLYPSVEKKVIEEIDRVVGDREPTAALMKELKYLKQVLDETLRLYPIVPSTVKFAEGDDVLPNGARVEKGMAVQYSPWTVHRYNSVS